MTTRIATALVAMTLALGALAVRVRAAEVSAQARLDRSQARVGESVTLAIEVRGAQDASAPALAAPDGLDIRYVGPATQLSIVNGETSASITHRYMLTASKPGTYTLGPISVERGGQVLQAGTVRLDVGDAPAPAATPAADAGDANAPLRLVLAAAKTRAYLHERVPLRLALRVGAVRVTDLHYPSIPGDGFAIDQLGEPTQRREQTAEGVVQVVEFATTLTPLRAGTLTVGPAELELSLFSPRRRGDPFFEQFFGDDPFAPRKAITLRSQALALEVLPLPEAGKPAGFSGAVGRFDFDVQVAPQTVQAGDPVTITMTVRGDGGLEHVTPPTIAARDDLRVYPVQEPSAPTPAEPRRAPTSRTFEQVVIPQRAGQAALPPMSFSYFDPEAGAYRTVTRPTVVLTVTAPAAPDASRVVGAPPPAPGVPAAASEPLGRDIVFIKDAPGRLAARGARLYASPLFWAYQLLPLTGWLAALAWDRRRRLHDDPRYVRFTRAGREARRAIDEARAKLQAGERDAFYDTLATALRDYVTAKFELPAGSVSADTIGARLRAAGVAEDTARELSELFAACEAVRYAPGAADGDMQHTLERADAIVRALERTQRAPQPAAAAAIVAMVVALAATIAASADDPRAFFFRGNALYADGRYAEAAQAYEQVLATGRESGALHFNLGNARFKTGDLGRAILSYERARRLMPRDPDVRANLELARSDTRAPAPTTPLWTRLVFPLAPLVATDTLFLVASALYTVLMALLVVARLVRRAERGARAGAWITALGLAVVLASAGYRLATVEWRVEGVVVDPGGTTVRFEPADAGTPRFEARTGTVLRVLGAREGWAQVARDDGERGWVPRAALDVI